MNTSPDSVRPPLPRFSELSSGRGKVDAKVGCESEMGRATCARAVFPVQEDAVGLSLIHI